MAIGANSSDKQVVGGSLFTGLHNVKVIAINPTLEEMKAMGINAQKDPQYLTTTDKGVNKMRIDFYLASATQGVNLGKTTKISFWIEDSVRTNQNNNKEEWINKYGNTTWGSAIDVPPTYDWYSTDGMRKCYIGEGDLTSFIKSWANVDPKDQATFDNISNIANGDLTEIKALYEIIKMNQVKVLLGVKDGKYQVIYTKYFERAYRNTFTGWKKALEGEYGEFKDADYQNDLTFKPYVGTATVEGDAPTNLDTPTGAAPAYKF